MAIQNFARLLNFNVAAWVDMIGLPRPSSVAVQQIIAQHPCSSTASPLPTSCENAANFEAHNAARPSFASGSAAKPEQEIPRAASQDAALAPDDDDNTRRRGAASSGGGPAGCPCSSIVAGSAARGTESRLRIRPICFPQASSGQRLRHGPPAAHGRPDVRPGPRAAARQPADPRRVRRGSVQVLPAARRAGPRGQLRAQALHRRLAQGARPAAARPAAAPAQLGGADRLHRRGRRPLHAAVGAVHGQPAAQPVTRPQAVQPRGIAGEGAARHARPARAHPPLGAAALPAPAEVPHQRLRLLALPRLPAAAGASSPVSAATPAPPLPPDQARHPRLQRRWLRPDLPRWNPRARADGARRPHLHPHRPPGAGLAARPRSQLLEVLPGVPQRRQELGHAQRACHRVCRGPGVRREGLRPVGRQGQAVVEGGRGLGV
ncbi:hypothetical protein B0J12DRAFT_167337 [Macrophomina phaseolina]|uniref:Uncharacterized protein n=1 Tax=Macrophomina phaseolina TaxID=35725 RepID=A0ABQ8GSA2_9PEZI|nr:hypothetical protein B0J12DRAFT_167337 [Macrophomina phaseolina]